MLVLDWRILFCDRDLSSDFVLVDGKVFWLLNFVLVSVYIRVYKCFCTLNGVSTLLSVGGCHRYTYM